MPLPGSSLALSSCAETGKTAEAKIPKKKRLALSVEVKCISFYNLA